MGGSLSARLTLWRLPRYFVAVTVTLLVLILGGGYFAAQRGAKRLLEPLRWFGIVQYESMSVGLGGGVEFRNLVISHTVNGKPEDVLRAGVARIDTPGLIWLILAARHGAPNTDKSSLAGFMGAARPFGDSLPAAFPAADALRVHLTQPVIGRGPRAFYDLQWFGLEVAAPFATEGCGQPQFSAADLKAMRLPEAGLEIDLEFAVTGPDQARVGLVFNVPESSRAALDMRLRWPAPDRLLDANWDQVVLVERTWQVQDAGFVLARNRFCARKLGVTRDTFVDQHVEAIENRLTEFNAVPQLELLNAYRRYLSRGGEIRWHSQPSPAMAMGQFSRFRPPEQVRILNATVETIRGTAVRFGFDFVQPSPTVTPLGTEAVATTTPPDATGATPVTATPTTPAPNASTTSPTATSPIVTTVTASAPTNATTAPTTTATNPPLPIKPVTTPTPTPATVSAPATVGAPPRPVATVAAPTSTPTPAKPITTPPRTAPIDPLAQSPATVSRPPPNSSSIATTPPATIATTKNYGATTTPPTQPIAPPRPNGPLKYEDLANYEGRRVVIRSRYNSIRTGTLVKYTDSALTLRLEGRQAGLELSMPRQTVRDVLAAGN